MKRMGMRAIQTIAPNSRTFWRGCDRMTRLELFKQSTKFTYILEKDEEDGIG
jgi:hypothetical protein